MSLSSLSGLRGLKSSHLFAGLACAALLPLASAPALAQDETLERVEVRGRIVEMPVRYDVSAACVDFEYQFLKALARTWVDDGRYGEVQVQMVLDKGMVDSAEARGFSSSVARQVRRAVHRLDCEGQKAAGPQLYRFVVDFVPESARQGSTRIASIRPGRPQPISGG